MELVEQIESAAPGHRDEFNIERRFEQRYPQAAVKISGMMLGYEHNRESALAVLSFLDEQFDINISMKQAVLELIK